MVVGHGGLVYVSGYAPGAGSNSIADNKAFFSLRCGHCGQLVNAAVLVYREQAMPSGGLRVLDRWLRCTSCGAGSVITAEGIQIPGVRLGDDLGGLPGDVQQAYDEARNSASVNAWTGVEMLCRKILMHVAVDKGAEEGQNFVSYLDYLEREGYVPPVMREWVDFIRKHGNEATHELPAIDAARGKGTLIFTEQLLRSVYEMADLAKRFAAPPTTTG